MREEKSFLKGLCDTECYVKIASIASGQFHCGIAHFQKEKDKSEFEKVSEWDTMEEYDNVER